MMRVKLTTGFPDFPFLRQTPGWSGRWGDCQFYVDQDVEECDWWVVFEGLTKQEATRCPPGNTVFITGEPPDVKRYDEGFLHQFSTLITCHREIKHPHVIFSQQGHPWLVGLNFVGRQLDKTSISKDFDELKALNHYEKDKEISVVASAKAFTKGHAKRLEFVRRLKAHFGERLDVYGIGINEIRDKWDALTRYRYHIALENCSYPDYVTEKLYDVFLAGAYPFYYGCPNIADYFPSDCLTVIDIDDFDGSVAVIEEAMLQNLYEHTKDILHSAKRLVLERYNLFAFIAGHCQHNDLPQQRRQVSLLPEQAYQHGILSKFRRWLGDFCADRI